jgi:hypothetical protein
VKGHIGKTGVGKCTNGSVQKKKEPAKKKLLLDKKKTVVDIVLEAKTNLAMRDELAEQFSPLPCELLGSLSLNRSEKKHAILPSCSDTVGDITSLVMGSRFCICTCGQEADEVLECECPGEIVMAEADLVSRKPLGVVVNFPLFTDPETEEIMKPNLLMGSWDKEKPNILGLTLELRTKKVEMDGEVQLEVIRAVEMVKGRNMISILWKASFKDVIIRKDATDQAEVNLENLPAQLWEMVETEQGVWSPKPGTVPVEAFEEESTEEEYSEEDEEDSEEEEDVVHEGKTEGKKCEGDR